MEREIAMTEVEFREQVEQDDGRGDLRDQIHGVRLEVEKVRAEMTGQIGGLETQLSNRIGGVGLEVEKVRSEMTGQIGGLERKLSNRISGVGLEVEKLRAEMTGQIGGLETKIGALDTRLSDRITEEVGKVRTELSTQISGVEKSLRAWMALGVSFIAVLVALMSVIN